jgi:tetratricopeptide (TPR) repeat protein
MKLTVFCVLFFMATSGFGQGSMAYYEQFFMPDDPRVHNELKFSWNFDGKLQAFMNDGLTQLDEKRYEHAAYAFAQAIEESPSFAPAFFYRAICYKNLDSLQKAESDFLAAKRISPKEPVILLELARLYIELNSFLRAKNLLEQITEIDKTYVEAYFQLGIISLSEDDLPKASRYFSKCNDINPNYPKGLVQEAIVTFAKNRRKNKNALALLDKAVQADSTYQPALFWRALVHTGNDQYEKALDDWNRMVRYNPTHTLLLFIRGAYHTDRGEFDKAFVDLKKIATSATVDENRFTGDQSERDKMLDIQFATSYLTRNGYGLNDEAFRFLKQGYCYLFTRNRAKAKVEFMNSNRAQESAVATFFTALTYEHMAKHDSAFTFYNKVLEMDNDNFDAHKKRGIYFSELKDWKKAYKDFAEMERIEPTMNVTYKLRGTIRIQFKDYYGCILDMTRYLKSDTTEGQVFFTRAFCLEQVKDLKGALNDYRKSITFKPGNVVLYEKAVLLSLATGDTLAALQEIDRAEKRAYPSAYLLCSKARILIQQSKLDSAQDLLTAIQQKFHYIPSLELLAELDLLQGMIELKKKNYKEAVRKFNSCRKRIPDNKESLFFRGLAYLGMGDKPSAINDFRFLKNSGYEKATPILAQLLAQN